VSIEDLHIEVYHKKDGTEGFKLAGKIVGFDFVANGRTAQPAESKPATTSKAATDWDSLDSDVPF
jgi:hypothetical protein